MRVFLTGHRGQLGSALIKELSGCNLITSDLDICDYHSVRRFLLEYKDITHIINCAAYTNVDDAEDDVKNWDVNAAAPAMMAELAAGYGMKFIQISSDYVYGDQTHPTIQYTCPLNAYGKAKMLGDIGVYTASKRNLIIRVQNLCSDKKGIVKKLFDLSINGEEIVIDDEVTVGPTSVYFLAKDIVSMMKNNLYGIYNYGPLSTVSVKDLLLYISPSAINKAKFSPVSLTRKAIRKKDCTMDMSRTNSFLDLKTWQEYVDDILKRIKDGI